MMSLYPALCSTPKVLAIQITRKGKNKMLKITNVEVNRTEYGSAYALSCKLGDARYHVWLNKETKTMAPDAPLYKNSIAKRDEPGYFKTRKLRPDTTFGAELIKLMLAQANAQRLFEKTEQNVDEQAREHKAAHAAAVALHSAKEAGPELLKVLQAIADFWTDSPQALALSPFAQIMDDDQPIAVHVRRAIALAKGGQ